MLGPYDKTLAYDQAQALKLPVPTFGVFLLTMRLRISFPRSSPNCRSRGGLEPQAITRPIPDLLPPRSAPQLLGRPLPLVSLALGRLFISRSWRTAGSAAPECDWLRRCGSHGPQKPAETQHLEAHHQTH